MGEIYMNASRVVIWLGDAGEDSHLVFQHLARFRQHQDDVRSGRSKPTDAFGESHLNPPSYEEATSVALERLFQRPWFFRTWVIQENALSKEALICCGSESASWEELFRPMGSNSGLSDRPIHGIDYGDRAHQIDVLSPSNRSDACRAVLKYSRDCQVTDPKDRVYAILGLLKPGLVKVEYESSVQDIYRSFAQAIIEDSGSIQLLNLCGPKRALPGLPSWVPDFNARRSSCHLPDLNERSVGIHMHWFDTYLTRALPGLRFNNNGKELVVKGKAIDTVRAVGDEMPVSKEYARGTEGFSRILSGWENLAVDNLPTQSSSTGSTSADPRVTISHAFLATLVALNTYCGDENSNPYMPFGGVLWYKQHGTGELMMREPQYFEDIEYCTMLSLGDMDDAWWYDSDYDWYVKELEKAIYGRRLFVTEGGYLGLGEPLVQAGDEIGFLCGNVYPFAVRKSTRDTFTLLGDCCIYKLDVLKLFEDHKKPVVEFNIE
ncbi:hypothetical protein Daus18300_006637 [Diaporthe australafricana]|uniref:Heterokaryon incompatibility domain-containing protein n=1 Tax=Diaporthe australafricana TaxID=127596 RepID=A0ABR3WSY9_9PEZI